MFPRRDMLRLLTALPFYGAIAGNRAQAAPDPAGRLLSVFRRPRSAAIVGRRHLAGHPEEAAPARLLRLIEDRVADAAGLSRSGLGQLGPARLRSAVRAAVARDFAARRIVEIDGWLLAETESRLCALAALSETGEEGPAGGEGR